MDDDDTTSGRAPHPTALPLVPGILPDAPVMVPFGTKPHQILTPEVAGMVLSLWHQTEPLHFGAYLSATMTGEDIGEMLELLQPSTRRRRSNA